MTEAPGTQILETKVRPGGPDASRVELVIADDTDLENAKTTIVISLSVKHSRTPPFVVDLQFGALYQATQLIREHTDAMEELLEEVRRAGM